MADDLKPILTKILASKGEKKFFFAYGAGKRKDGKGDGELAVRGQKPKKADIEGELADCKQVLEGVCWTGKGANDSETVYFQGKSTKLSGMVVAKMALTARRVAGRQYDFQVPSPEEEARAAKLKEEEGDEAPAAQAASATPAAGKAEAAPGTLESEYQARVKALTDDLKKALTSGTAAGNEAKLRFSESQLLSRKKDFPQALALLKVVEEQIKLALAGAAGANGAAPKGTANGDPAAEWKTKLAQWSPAIKKAMADKGPNAAAMAKLLAQATALSKPGGDMAQAIAKLTECHALATGGASAKVAAEAPKATADGDPAAEWKTKLAQWTPAIKKAMADKGPNAAAMAKLLAQATALSKPGGDMAQALAKLTECHALATGGAAATPAQVATAQGTAQPQAQAGPARTLVEEAVELNRLRDELKPLMAAINKAVVSHPEQKNELLMLVKGFQSQVSITNEKRSVDEGQRSLEAIRALLASLSGGTKTEETDTAKTTEPAQAEAKKPLTFEDSIREAEAALNQLKDTNPFRDNLTRRLEAFKDAVKNESALIAQGMAEEGDLTGDKDKTVNDLKEDAAAALAFADKLTDVFVTIEKLIENDPLRGQLMYSWNAEVAFARRSNPPVKAYVSEGMNRLAALEQQAKAALPAAAQAQPQEQPASQEPQDAQAEFQKLQQEILPAYQEALVARSDDEALKSLMRTANTKARKENDFPGALVALKELAQLLAKGEAPVDNPEELEANYKKLYEELEQPFYDATLEGDVKRPDEGYLQEHWRNAAKKAGAKNFRGAIAELQKLAVLLGKPAAEAGEGEAPAATETEPQGQAATPTDANAQAAAGSTEAAQTETKKPLTFEDSIREAEAALNQLKDTNPFRDSLTRRLESLKETLKNESSLVAQGMVEEGELTGDKDKTLNEMKEDAAAALAFADKLTEVFVTIEKLNENDPLRGQLMYSWNAEVAFARRSNPPVKAYVSEGMNRLAALEQQAKAALPAAAQAQPQEQPASQEPQDAQAEFQKLQQEILPAYQEALVARSDDEALKSLMRTANTKARKENDFPGALVALKELAQLLAKGEAPVDNPEELEADYKKLYEELEQPFYDATLESDVKRPDDGYLRELWQNAAKKAGAKNFRGAIAELQKLAQLLASAPGEVTEGESPAAQGGALGELKARADKVWDDIEEVADANVRDELLTEYRQLEKIIPSPEEIAPDNLAESEKLLAALEQKVKAALQAAAAPAEEKVSGETEGVGVPKAESEEQAATSTESPETEREEKAESAEKESEEGAGQAVAKAESEGQATTPTESAETAQPTEGETQPDTEPMSPTARWDAERTKAVTKLKDEIKVIVATKDQEAGKAELELKAVIKQLGGKLETQKQAVVMEHYLKDDEVVADVCDLAFDLKTPLLKVLGEITSQLPA